ncbi:MAG: Ring finger domain [Candidatus Dependentiae bacterium]|nr:Ring finger domain [Candidatus Dependentiae bacterium]
MKKICEAFLFLFCMMFATGLSAVEEPDFSRHTELVVLLQDQPEWSRACRSVKRALSAAEKGESLQLQEKRWSRAEKFLAKVSVKSASARELRLLCGKEEERLQKKRRLKRLYTIAGTVGVVSLLAFMALKFKRKKPTAWGRGYGGDSSYIDLYRPSPVFAHYPDDDAESSPLPWQDSTVLPSRFTHHSQASTGLPLSVIQMPAPAHYPDDDALAAKLGENSLVHSRYGDLVLSTATIELHNRWANAASDWLTEFKQKMRPASLRPGYDVDRLSMEEAISLCRFGVRSLENLTLDDGYTLLRHFGRLNNPNEELSDHEAIAWMGQLINNMFPEVSSPPFGPSFVTITYFHLDLPPYGDRPSQRFDFGRLDVDRVANTITLFDPPLAEISRSYVTTAHSELMGCGRMPAFDCTKSPHLTVQDNFALLVASVRQQHPTEHFSDREALARGAEMLLANGVSDAWSDYSLSINDASGIPHQFSMRVRISDERIGFNIPPTVQESFYKQDAEKSAAMIAKAFEPNVDCSICIERFNSGEIVVCWDCGCGNIFHLSDASRMAKDKSCPMCRGGGGKNRFYVTLPARP